MQRESVQSTFVSNDLEVFVGIYQISLWFTLTGTRLPEVRTNYLMRVLGARLTFSSPKHRVRLKAWFCLKAGTSPATVHARAWNSDHLLMRSNGVVAILVKLYKRCVFGGVLAHDLLVYWGCLSATTAPNVCSISVQLSDLLAVRLSSFSFLNVGRLTFQPWLSFAVQSKNNN